MSNKRFLTLYPNCSLGGMTTVYRNRALAQPNDRFEFIFNNNFAGAGSYSLPNTEIRIIPSSRTEAYLKYHAGRGRYDEIRLTSLPKLTTCIPDGVKLIYEFHSSDEQALQNEISLLDADRVDEFWVPSRFLKEVVDAFLHQKTDKSSIVVKNLIDETTFKRRTVEMPGGLKPNTIPIVWIGRFDKGKNPLDLLRALSLVDKKYHAFVVVSLESDPNRLASFLSEATQYGVSNQITVMQNLSPSEISDLYNFVASKGGALCSTSLGESFGYAIAEAHACGLRSIAYSVGALPEHKEIGANMKLVDVGDIHQLAAELEAIGATAEQARKTSRKGYLHT